uniref:Uncharacterized protein n=1 Tax=Candidatus Kentrum sp. SD TaxID=2126332 RepID=A0A450Z0V1_9GAMM|nr:MAG: hypothetical protein BECKSD772F_GA0070984_13811 [Candidatus Kentron sp. SD]VFK80655.1 MAG: hypothetical protein BECKSD772D_GA0070982_11375 [Candidatus Kentron sp. SD]
MLPENKRFLILIGVIGIVVIALSGTARFLGSRLWSSGPQEAETSAALPAEQSTPPPVIPAEVTPPVQAPPPKAPSHPIAEGKVPLEFQALEARLAAMEQALSNRSGEKQALKEKMAEADALISRAEGIVRRPDAPSSAPVKSKTSDQGGNTDIEHLRQRLGILKDRLGTDGQ